METGTFMIMMMVITTMMIMMMSFMKNKMMMMMMITGKYENSEHLPYELSALGLRP